MKYMLFGIKPNFDQKYYRFQLIKDISIDNNNNIDCKLFPFNKINQQLINSYVIEYEYIFTYAYNFNNEYKEWEKLIEFETEDHPLEYILENYSEFLI